ncbi:MAG: hypothetical protein ABS49_08770 [Erythrobacter sp. SCN 62-14]|nr:MAG: hypothetical protein ABS49_08770 [Erythrobacter sp. SCN 62-14]
MILAAMGTLNARALALVPVVAGGVMVAASSDTDNEPATAAAGAARLAGREPAATAASPVQALAPSLPASLPVAGPLASLQLTSFDPDFALMAQRTLDLVAAHQAAAANDPETGPMSALLIDPVALDGVRKPCLTEQSPAVVIDLDPEGATFVPPTGPTPLPEHAATLASLREAGIIIGWISQNSISVTGAVRNALEQSGLDPQGQDVLLLIAQDDQRKQSLRESFARSACIVAIAGDERADFDERFRYLRDPSVGAKLETLIGEGPWFLSAIFSPPPPAPGRPLHDHD